VSAVPTRGKEGGNGEGVIEKDVLGFNGAVGIETAKVERLIEDGDDSITNVDIDNASIISGLSQVSVKGDSQGSTEPRGEWLNSEVVHDNGGIRSTADLVIILGIGHAGKGGQKDEEAGLLIKWQADQ